MRVLPLGALAALITASVTATGSLLQQQPTFRSGARTVAVYATVTDKSGRLIPDLGREVFEVRDNGKPQPLSIFSNEVQPISVIVMLDRSTSMRGNFRLVQQASEEFVRRLGPGDKARIGTFSETIDIEPREFTGNQDELLRILRTDLPVGGPTPLWNATDQAIDSLREQQGRKVILIFSDGADEPGNFSMKNKSIMDVMRRAQEEDVMVYAIGLQSTMLTGRGGGGVGGLTGRMTSLRPDPGLAAIADDTGGGYFELTRADDLGQTFAQVAEELHHQYALGFEPPRLDDKTHKLEVRVSEKGTKVRARKEYFAGRTGS